MSKHKHEHEHKEEQTENPNHHREASETGATPQPGTPTLSAQPAESAASPDAPVPDDKTRKLEEETAQVKDKLLRLAAEFDNFKKRKAKEFETVIKMANDELVMEIITVLDNFERALAAAKTNDDFSSFHQGVELIYRQFEEILKKQGVRPIETVGQEFNPHVHEAVQQVDQADKPSHTVVQEMQKGYMLHDRMVRAAKVIVNK
jgi:molecular chaperone GrpE